MSGKFTHDSEESPSRELAIVAVTLIQSLKKQINEGRKAHPEMGQFPIETFEPDTADFERVFAPYLERIRLRERIDVLKKYQHYAGIAEATQLTVQLNALNMQIAMIEHPDVQ